MAVVVVGAYEPEWRYSFQVTSPSGPHVVVSGLGTTGEVKGMSDDHFEDYDVEMIVGPWWKDLWSVVPIVTGSFVSNDDADEDDEQGWAISGLTWDAVSGTGAFVNEERIRLKFHAGVKGENQKLIQFGYYLTARGRELGHEGLDSPGPVHPNHP
jgi:hypothetical protein